MDPETDGVVLVTKRQCPECGRIFDLLDETDAAEWYYGHDCEEDILGRRCDWCAP